MNWVIYSVGDSAFLEMVLNAVAMITGQGIMSDVASIGLLVGVILMGFQAIISDGGSIKFQNVLLSMIVFAILFGNTTTVKIEDAYSSSIRTVDNVPYGVVAIGSMVSEFGYIITTNFEQVFGGVSMTGKGFANSLKIMADLRKSLLNKSSAKDAASSSGNDYWQSISNYITDCTLAGIDQGAFTFDSIQKGTRFPNQDAWQQLKYDSLSYGTELKLASHPGSNAFKNCSEAFVILNGVITSEFRLAIAKTAAQEMGNGTTAQTFAVELSDAFAALGSASINAQDYMVATAIEPIFSWSVAQNELSFQRVGSAMMIHSAIQQRNEKWGADQALFNTIVRPMMAFFEGLLYAVTPFMAFLVGLGPMGFSLIGKYLLMMVWIQLWMPILSITNLYLHMAMGGKMDALISQTETNLASFYGVYAMDMELQNWLSVGAMLAAATPSIALMLVYGSAVTATSLTGKFGSADAGPSIPSMMKTGEVSSFKPMVDGDRNNKTVLTGAAGALPAISSGTDISGAKMRAQQLSQSSQQAFANTLGSQWQHSMGSNGGQVLANATKIGETASASQSEAKAHSIGGSILESSGNTSGSSRAAQTLLGMGASTGASLSALGFSVNGSLTAQAKESLGVTDSNEEAFVSAYNKQASSTSQESASYQKSLANEVSEGKTGALTNAFGITEDEGVKDSAQQAVQASETAQQADSIKIGNGSKEEVNPTNLLNRLSNDNVAKSPSDAALKGNLIDFLDKNRDVKNAQGVSFGDQVDSMKERLQERTGAADDNALLSTSVALAGFSNSSPMLSMPNDQDGGVAAGIDFADDFSEATQGLFASRAVTPTQPVGVDQGKYDNVVEGVDNATNPAKDLRDKSSVKEQAESKVKRAAGLETGVQGRNLAEEYKADPTGEKTDSPIRQAGDANLQRTGEDGQNLLNQHQGDAREQRKEEFKQSYAKSESRREALGAFDAQNVMSTVSDALSGTQSVTSKLADMFGFESGFNIGEFEQNTGFQGAASSSGLRKIEADDFMKLDPSDREAYLNEIQGAYRNTLLDRTDIQDENAVEFLSAAAAQAYVGSEGFFNHASAGANSLSYGSERPDQKEHDRAAGFADDHFNEKLQGSMEGLALKGDLDMLPMLTDYATSKSETADGMLEKGLESVFGSNGSKVMGDNNEVARFDSERDGGVESASNNTVKQQLSRTNEASSYNPDFKPSSISDSNKPDAADLAGKNYLEAREMLDPMYEKLQENFEGMGFNPEVSAYLAAKSAGFDDVVDTSAMSELGGWLGGLWGGEGKPEFQDERFNRASIAEDQIMAKYGNDSGKAILESADRYLESGSAGDGNDLAVYQDNFLPSAEEASQLAPYNPANEPRSYFETPEVPDFEGGRLSSIDSPDLPTFNDTGGPGSAWATPGGRSSNVEASSNQNPDDLIDVPKKKDSE